MAVDSELRIRRLRIDEALPRLDRYLNAAFLAGLPSVRIVHGKGTGVLRQAVHETLAEHPLVKSFRLGEWGEGGVGVTVVELANH
jgi:DNA mismatch repair protein MutS2